MRLAVVTPLASLLLTLAGAAHAETAPCPVFTKQVPMSHSWNEGAAQWSCRYVLTITGNGRRTDKGRCELKLVESPRTCVGAVPGSDSV